MNKEEILNKYIDLIDKGYCSDCNELNCIDNFPHAKITHAIRELQQENQELKLELSGYRQAILKDKEMLGLKEENDKLKKQLEEERNKVREYSYKLSNFRCEETYENQQKEFIEYLEEEMKKNINWYNSLTPHDKNYYYKDYVDKDTNYMVVLSKYKEIIGGKE